MPAVPALLRKAVCQYSRKQSFVDRRHSTFEQVLHFSAVEHRDPCSFRSEEKRRSAPAQACTEHGDILIFVARVFHLSFRVANPNRAKMIDRIQKRTITVLSFQPVSSK